MKGLGAFLLACAMAAFAPLWRPSPDTTAAGFPGWPTTLSGQQLIAQPLTARESAFAAEFPGRLGSFRAATTSVLLRWTARPTRLLHPAADCLRGAGYRVEPGPLFVDADHQLWGTSTARLGAVGLRVRERIVDARGQAFTDASSWYWAALLGRSEGPWWAWTVLEPLADLDAPINPPTPASTPTPTAGP